MFLALNEGRCAAWSLAILSALEPATLTETQFAAGGGWLFSNFTCLL